MDEIQQNLPRTEAEIEEVEVKQADRDLEADAKLSDRSNENVRLTESDFDDYMKAGRTKHTRNKKERMMQAGKNPVLKTQDELSSFIADSIYGKAPGEVRAYARV